MEMIRPGLWLGSFNTIKYASNYIKHVGVSRILNVAHEVDYDLSGFHLCKVPMRDGWESGFDRITHGIQCRNAIDCIGRSSMDRESILVHCAEGKSRSVHVIALWVSQQEGKCYEEVWREIRSYRPCVHEGSFSFRYGVGRDV